MRDWMDDIIGPDPGCPHGIHGCPHCAAEWEAKQRKLDIETQRRNAEERMRQILNAKDVGDRIKVRYGS